MSWNVNGLRAVVKKGFTDQIDALAPDVGLQETKAQDTKCKVWDSYEVHSSSAVKKGYSGTAVLTKHTPLSIQAGIGVEALDQEGRVLRLEFDNFHFVTVYTPNSSSGLKRLPFRGTWDEAFRDYLKELDADKPVVCCGDLNVAHAPIDLARPKSNYNKTPGYTQQEIDGMSALLGAGFVDTWRQAHPEDVKYCMSYQAEHGRRTWLEVGCMLVSERVFSKADSQRHPCRSSGG